MTDKTATITNNIDGTSHEYPLHEGTMGPPAVDISALYRDAGIFTYDPGFMATASCHSAITYIDGEQGILLYRGYPIEQLATKASFLEVAYLLLYGELPKDRELVNFERIIMTHTMLNENLKNFLNGFHYDAHPMAILCGVVGSLSAFYHESIDVNDPHYREISAHRLIAKVPTIAAAAYKHNVGEPIMYPRNDLRYGANFLHMMFATPCGDYEPALLAEKALNLLFILHADHEQNCSTSTVRMVGSSGANLFASCAAGVCALWGPLHGGANVEVLDMLERIHNGHLTPEAYVKLAKDKDTKVRLMGFGHRVYKNFDPRAKLLGEVAEELLARLGVDDPLLDIARRLEEIALSDPYFIERKLYPNVDFYSGVILRAIGIPTNMFTVIFAIGRLPGWIAHWREQRAGGSRIARPRQIYTGSTRADYVPMAERG